MLKMSKQIVLFFIFHVEADETGAALGAVMSPMALSIVQTEANISPFSYETDFPPSPEDGQLVVIADRLHEYLEAAWHDRGPVAGTITAPMAEMIAALDRAARGLLVQADRLFERRGASHDMASYLGQTYSTVNDL